MDQGFPVYRDEKFSPEGVTDKHLIKHILLGLAAVLVLIGCARPTLKLPAPPPVDWQRSPEQVIFQIHTAGGLVGPLDREANVPQLTVFGDGRALFERFDPDGTNRFYEGRVADAKLKALMAQADHSMTGLAERYMAMVVTDAGDTRFALATAAGNRRVSVYAFSPEPSEQEQDGAVLDRLRALRRGFLDALAESAVPYTPDSVTLLGGFFSTQSEGQPNREWPAGLPALPVPSADDPWMPGKVVVTGDAARELARQIPYRDRVLYRVGDRYYQVAVKPKIPLLH